MKQFSALITCVTECTVTVDAADAAEARTKIERGAVKTVALHDGGLDMCERFHDVEIDPESFGVDTL